MCFRIIFALVLLVHVALAAAKSSSLDDMAMKDSMKFHGLLSRAAADLSRQGKGRHASTDIVSPPEDYRIQKDASDRRRLGGMTYSDELDKCKSDLQTCEEEMEQPILLFTQMADKCKLKRKTNGKSEVFFEWSSKDLDDETYVFSDRPYQIAYTMTSEAFFDNFDDMFSEKSGGRPNGAITFRHKNTNRFEGPLISVFLEAAYKTDTGKFVYELSQSQDQEEVNSLNDFFEDKDGKDVVEYEMCSLFIDSGNFGGRQFICSFVDNRRLTLQHMTERFKEDGSVRSFVGSLGYEVELNSGTGEKENVLAKEDCEVLMSLIDRGLFPSVEVPEYQGIQKYIDEADLVSVIGKDKFTALLELHKEVVGSTIPLEVIKIHHMRGAANNDAFLDYHTDEFCNEHDKYSTIVVALNDNSSVKEGGDLYYLHEDGPVLASRAQGKAFAHSYNVLHGVSPHVGDRVSLILQFNHDLKMEDVGGRKLTEDMKRKYGLRIHVR